MNFSQKCCVSSETDVCTTELGQARELINSLEVRGDYLLPTTDVALRLGWDRLVKRAGIKDLRFHDLRHEAISRFFELGLNMAEVALISGHKDPKMLFRYTHLRAENIAAKLAKLSG
jgi:integrase